MSNQDSPIIISLKAFNEKEKLKVKREKKRVKQLKANKQHHKTAHQFEDYSYLKLFK